ncbi:MAG: cyclic nucleotide-binding domain-containing protein [Lachnospiraceae bacterium]|nr:cyclic nucleotide-binding domain-containing protein [Lachnospiraceae bacterium]
MGMQEFKKGDFIHRFGDPVNELEILLKGSVKISNSYSFITVSNGSILGIIETPGTFYAYDYYALEDTSLYASPFESSRDIEKVIATNPKISNVLASASVKAVIDVYSRYSDLLQEANSFYKFVKSNYQNYLLLCEKFSVPFQSFPHIEELEPFSPEEEFPSWQFEYYSELKKMPAEQKKIFFGYSKGISLGIILQSVDTIHNLLALSQQTADYLYETTSFVISEIGGDFFDLYSNLVFKTSKNPFNDTTSIEAAVSKIIIYLESHSYLDKEFLHKRITEYRQALREIEDSFLKDDDDLSQLNKQVCDTTTNSLKTILDYAKYPTEKRNEFESFIKQYKELSDKSSTDDSARKLRRNLTEHFYNIYESAITISLFEEHVPTVMKMFFYFGYMDEDLTGSTNATALFELANSIHENHETNVMTLYEWLTRVSLGLEEPSKNEFDLDYASYLREQRATGNITKEEEKQLISDKRQKLHFEIQNMFKTVNRITFGRVSTFCPILSEHNILKPLKTIYMDSTTVNNAIKEIKTIDFSCFYRETLFSDLSKGIQKEFVQKEVLPNIILMPNIGTRGSLWQEISGSRRDTPARMMISIFPAENIQDILIRLTGEYRWEMCKRIQGVHWNDVTDRSLTSEYCDYVQFYRKNRDLSQDAKDKMKLALQKAKNNYREVFVMDYISWVKYEGHGSPRLNRYARNILFTYCPFNRNLREEIKINPMYSDIIERYHLKTAQKIHLIDLVIQKLSSNGFDIPKEIEQQKDYLSM